MRCVAILLIISLITSCGINRQQGETIHRVNPDDSFPDRVILSKLKVTSAIQYHHWLDRLDPVDLGSLESADILFRNCAADTLSRDSMLFIYQEFRNHQLIHRGQLHKNYRRRLISSLLYLQSSPDRVYYWLGNKHKSVHHSLCIFARIVIPKRNLYLRRSSDVQRL